MTIPTITSITPSTGPTGGWTLCEIVGTNFRIPAAPPATGPVPPYAQTVAVTFGGTAAQAVKVLSATLLTALAPTHAAGVVNVVLTNIDDAGVPITGETVTKTGGFTFGLPDLTREPVIQRIFRELLRALKRVVHPNVVPMVHTEFDDVPGGVDVAMLAALPGITIAGPEIVEDREFSTNVPEEVEDGDATFREMRTSRTFALTFALTGAAEKQTQLLALLDATADFFDRTKWLVLARDPDDSTAGTVSYEMRVPLAPGFRITSAPNEANVRSFTVTAIVRGVVREGLAGVSDDLRRERGGRTTEDGVTIEVGLKE